MTIASRFQDLPLQRQLIVVFACLSIATTAISTATLTTLSGQRMQSGLTGKSLQYTRQLQRQMETVIAFEDKLSAREIFDSLAGDREVDGLAVYSENGSLIAGHGWFPSKIKSVNDTIDAGSGHVIALASVQSHEGPRGTVFVSLSNALILQMQRREAWIATGIGAAVVMAAILLAVWTARRISLRLVSIAEAANSLATGNLKPVSLDEEAKDEVGSLAHAFNVMVAELNRMSFEHDKLVSTERERLEQLVSERTQALEQSREMFRRMAESTKAIPFTLDLFKGSFSYIGAQAIAESGIDEAQWRSPDFLEVALPRETNPDVRRHFDECRNGSFEFETTVLLFNVRQAEMRWTGTCEVTADAKYLRGLMQDITDVRRLERELASAQKLESVGRLAAGVAHEINTPIQFVSDNVRFLDNSAADIATVIAAYRRLQSAIQEAGDVGAALRETLSTEEAVDLNFIMENMPPALVGATDGLNRIATIVRSMKEFAHPDEAEKTLANLNHAIESTLIIANNEFKYIADLETQFDELPLVNCHLGEINQVVLNLIVNAAHAIDDVVRDTGGRGKLSVKTRVLGNEVEIAVSDTGTGIPESARGKIFDPFFTTKEVGKGTGQGLSIAHNVIVKKHGGSLRFDTELGRGTTFFIRLPVDGVPESAEAPRDAA